MKIDTKKQVAVVWDKRIRTLAFSLDPFWIKLRTWDEDIIFAYSDHPTIWINGSVRVTGGKIINSTHEIHRRVVKVCSWCPNKDQITENLRKQWYKVSHGMCENCSKTWDK